MTRADHKFHLLYFHLGPFGRQDVHIHPCTEHEQCEMEYVGLGRNCGTIHYRVRHRVNSVWPAKDQEGKPLRAQP